MRPPKNAFFLSSLASLAAVSLSSSSWPYTVWYAPYPAMMHTVPAGYMVSPVVVAWVSRVHFVALEVGGGACVRICLAAVFVFVLFFFLSSVRA